MSEFKFSCPACGQHISSDTSNAGMSVACPACQTVLIVPQPPAAAPAHPALSIAASQARHTAAEASHRADMVSQSYAKPQGAGPGRPGTASGGAKGMSGLAIASFVCSLFLCAGCVPGIICGHLARRNLRDDPSVQGGAFAIAGLALSYLSLAACLVFGVFGMSAFIRGFKEAFNQAQLHSQTHVSHSSTASFSVTNNSTDDDTNSLWNLNLTTAEFPDRPAAGKIHGRDFTVQAALFQNGNITLRQGRPNQPDLQVMIITFVTNSASLAGKKYDISPANADLSAGASPHVHVRWKNEADPGTSSKAYVNGFALKLELGDASDNGDIPAKIYLCLPDDEKSYVAGSFTLKSPKAPAKKGKKKNNKKPPAN